jgi:3-isopropylmalate/(R)-2-methylmalate dehydratase small subunit
MTLQPFTLLDSLAVQLLRDDVDTDQIIPARFLTTTERTGLGRHLFADWRYDAQGEPRADFPLNTADPAQARVLVAGRNFGCGSSREHAPWALLDWGFRAVIAPSFADIFRNNAQKNGLLAITLATDLHAELVRALGGSVASGHGPRLQVNLADDLLAIGDVFVARFETDAFAKRCLLDGVDELGFLLAQSAEISAFEASGPPLVPTIGAAFAEAR